MLTGGDDFTIARSGSSTGTIRRDSANGLQAVLLLAAIAAFLLADLVPCGPEILTGAWVLPVLLRFAR